MNKIPVYSKDGKLLSFTTAAKARILLKRKKARVIEYKPFKIKIYKEGEKMFVSYKNDIINLDKVQTIELKDNKIMFFMDNVTSRTNWKFESEEKAQEVFDELKNLITNKSFKAWFLTSLLWKKFSMSNVISYIVEYIVVIAILLGVIVLLFKT